MVPIPPFVEAFEACRTIVVTGGTGTFGHAMIEYLLENFPDTRVRCISRDEFKQHEMKQEFAGKEERLSFFLGDVRDAERLALAFTGADLVIHAAALKQVPALEYNPLEAIQTNIIGSANVIKAAINTDVRQAILLSSDKAVHPINLYGATKLCAEKLFIQANSYTPHSTRFNVARYGNISGSRGSVLEVYGKAIAEGRPLPVTDLAMSRFWMVIKQAVELVRFIATQPVRGGIFVPHLSAFDIADLCRAVLDRQKDYQFTPDEIMITGIRPGEKLHESLVTEDERGRMYVHIQEKPLPITYYLIRPAVQNWQNPTQYDALPGWQRPYDIDAVTYSSDQWPARLSVGELRKKVAYYCPGVLK